MGASRKIDPWANLPNGPVLYRKPMGIHQRDYRSPKRRRLENAIEAAIAALDAYDGDPDIEEQFDGEDDSRALLKSTLTFDEAHIDHDASEAISAAHIARLALTVETDPSLLEKLANAAVVAEADGPAIPRADAVRFVRSWQITNPNWTRKLVG